MSTEVPMDSIVIDDRLFDLKPKVVTALMESIAKVGIIQPPVVRRAPKGKLYLLAGRHRYEANRRLGNKRIKVEIINAKAERDYDMLTQIDENLVRLKMTASERDKALIIRKEIYERLHPETRQGHGRDGGGKDGQTATVAVCPSFAADTARKTGQSERSIRRSTRRAARLGLEVMNKVQGTALDVPKELDALADLPEADRAALVERAAAGEKVSAVAILDPVRSLGLKRLNDAWDKASPADHEAFCRLHGLTAHSEKAS